MAHDTDSKEIAEPQISTWVLLKSLGFVDDVNVHSDDGPGLSFDFGNLKLDASQCITDSFQPVVSVSGVITTARSIAMINSMMPREMKSMEQVTAWISWILDSGSSYRAFLPEVPVTWLAVGREHWNLLPWVAKRLEHEEYEDRASCIAKRDWVKLAVTLLTISLSNLDDDAPVRLEFDGEVLKFRCGHELVALQAIGSPWMSSYKIPAGGLHSLPKRLMSEHIEISVRKTHLTIGQHWYRGIEPVPSEGELE